MRRVVRGLLALIGLTIGTAGVQAGGIVYMGTDPSFHGQFNSPPASTTAIQLAGNAVRFAGGSSSPSILLVGSGNGFASSAPVLTAAGFSFTQITAAQLSSTNLNAYQVVYFAPTTNEASTYMASTAQVQSYVNGGGGLVVEAEVFDANSWAWVPGAGQIGHSGSTNVGGDSGITLNGAAPLVLTNGLTAAGLSNWGISVHSTFGTPGAAGFSTLAFFNGTPYIIYRGAVAVPEPASLTVFGAIAVGGVVSLLRRRKTAVA